MDSVSAALQRVTQILALGDNLFGGYRAWVNYREALEDLEVALQSWERILEEYDLRGYLVLLKALTNARDQVNSAHAELTNLRAKLCCYVNVAYAACYPGILEKRTTTIKDTVNGIPAAIDTEQNWRDKAKKLSSDVIQIMSDFPEEDSRFVPIVKYQDQINEALTVPGNDSPLLILLHGDSGLGKSTAAWHVASVANKKASSFSPEENNRNASTSTLVPRFRAVIFIECGRFKKIQQVLEDLNRKLGSKSITDSEMFKRLKDAGKVLVILDDVQDCRIPERIIQLGGRYRTSLKFIMTSTHSDLCNAEDPAMIRKIHFHIRDISKDHARQILAKQVNLLIPEKDVPPYLQGVITVMDEIAEKAGNLPLALSCCASTIMSTFKDDKSEWERVGKGFYESLESVSNIKMFCKEYGKSAMAAMRLGVESLMEDPLGKHARDLFLLFQVVQTELVDENFIESLFVRCLKLGDPLVFRKTCDLLHRRNFISFLNSKIPEISTWEKRFGLERDTRSRVWSMHCVRKNFIKNEGIEGCVVGEMGRSVKERLEQMKKLDNWSKEDLLFAMLCVFHISSAYTPLFFTQLFIQCQKGVPIQDFTGPQISAIILSVKRQV